MKVKSIIGMAFLPRHHSMVDREGDGGRSKISEAEKCRDCVPA